MTTSTKPRRTKAEENPFAEVDAKVAAAEARIAALTRAVHVELPDEQRAIQAEIDAATKRNDNNGFVAAWDALTAAKIKRNAAIDELEQAQADAAAAKAEAKNARRVARRTEMVAAAAELVSSTAAELLEEQARLPARLAEATRNFDVALVRDLRQRQAELPDLVYAARMVETARAVEDFKRRAEDERRQAEEKAPALAAAEKRLQEAQAERNRIAREVNLHRAEAQEADRAAGARERDISALLAEAFKREAPVVRSLIGWNPTI